MPKRMKMPFSDLGPEAWQNLALTALIAFYLVQIGNAWLNNALFQPMGLDFLAFWSAGRIATLFHYSHIYDLPLLHQIQVQQLTEHGVSALNYAPAPAALFAVFIVPFQLMSFLDSQWGYWIWSSVNLAALVLYLVYFGRQVAGTGKPQGTFVRVLAFMLLSYPVFQSFFWGQIEVFLLICCGEFIRNALANKPIASGLWLGGLLAKPQVLILIVPALLLMNNWRVLAGFIAASVGILGASLALAGIGGMQGMAGLWLSYLPGIATNAPEIMANWRMLGVHFSALISPMAAWSIVALGMLASLVIWVLLWRDHPPFGSPRWVILMGGIFSISCAFTWHSHIHLMMVLIPFLVYAAAHRVMPPGTYEIWALAIPGIVVLILVAAVLIALAGLPQNQFGGLLLGSTGLALNVWMALRMLKYARALPATANEAGFSPLAERPAAGLNSQG